MQDRYAGDLGDYSKLALIRALGGVGLRIGVHWCLADDESHNNDGRHIDYLVDDRANLRACDEPLHTALARMIARDERSVAALERLEVWPADTRFFHGRLSYRGLPVAERDERRADWMGGALDATADADAVFFDPDNGLEIASVGRRSIRAPKFVYLDELAPFWGRGQSLVIYQHLTRRGTADEQAQRRTEQLRRALGAERVDALRFRRGTARLYLVVGQPGHRRALGAAVERLLARWSAHFEAHG